MSFDTPIAMSGPLRKPRQMLADQAYGGHTSIHDDEMAEKLGFRAGPIEGPTHFSQFDPLLVELWGQEWFERGCISSHFKNMVIEGEEVRAFVERPKEGQTSVRAWAEKADGTPVLEATASLGSKAGPTLLEQRRAKLTPPGNLVVLSDLEVGMKGAVDEIVQMAPDQHMGDLYPFSLTQKLVAITENSPWYHDANASPWGKAIVPTEMVSVLAEYTNRKAAFPTKGPAIGLFADLEIKMIEGPLFVGEEYLLRREIVAIAESKRTESYWVRTRILDKTGNHQLAEVMLNHAIVKNSFANYDSIRASLEENK
jgi:hypothetical protein